MTSSTVEKRASKPRATTRRASKKVIGSQTPRIREGARLRTKEPGQDAIELLALYDTTLDPWQELVLVNMLSERADGRYQYKDVLLSTPRRQGKSELLFARCKVALLLTNERAVISSISLKDSRMMFNRLKRWIEADIELSARATIDSGKGSELIEFDTGGRLRFVARTDSAARGEGCDLLIFDEAQKLDSEVFGAMDPLLADSTNPQAVFFGTPTLDKDIGNSKFASLREVALAKALKSGLYLEWSADPSSDPAEESTWAQGNPAYGIRGVDRENMARAYAVNSAQEFATERLGIWGTVMHRRLIEEDFWNSLATFDPAPDPLVLALDISPENSSGEQTSSVSLVTMRPDGKPQIEVLKNSRGTQWVRDFLLRASQKFAVPVVIDSGSEAAGHILPLQQEKVQVLEVRTQEHKAACAHFLATSLSNGLRHFDQVELNLAIAGAVKRKIGDGFGFSPVSPTVDVTPLISCALALYGLSMIEVRKQRQPVSATPKVKQPSTQIFGSYSSRSLRRARTRF